MAEQRNEIRALASFCNAGNIKVNINSETKMPCMQCNGTTVTGLMSICIHLAMTSGKTELAGKDAKSRALIGQWVEYRCTEVDRCQGEKDDVNVFKELNAYLSTRTFFVGHQYTFADLLMYYGLHSRISGLTFHEKEKYTHLSRWFDHVQRVPNARQHLTQVSFSLNRLYAGFIPH